MRRLLLLAALIAACGGPARTVIVNGREVSYEDAANDVLGRGKRALAAGHTDEALKAFRQVIDRYDQSAAADDARFLEGQTLARAGKLQEAQAKLTDLLEKHPNTSFKKEAALELSAVQTKLGNTQEAAEAMRTAVSQMSDAEKQQAARSIADAYARTGEPGEAARFAARALEAAQTPEERAARLVDYEKALHAAPGPAVAQLVADLDRRSAAWPPAALKLARLQLHAGDRAHADELARQILSEVNTGPVAQGAQSIQLALSSAGNVRPNLIGIVLPLTGEYKALSDLMLNAMALAVDLQNRGGVQVSIKDSKGEPDAAAQAVEELVREGAVAILGPIALAEGQAAAVRAQQLGVPILSLSRAEGLTQIGEYVFRDMPTNSAQARAIAQYAQKKLGVRSFGILQPDSSYGEEVTRYFWDALDAGGSAVTAYDHYPQRTTTFKPFVQRLVGRTQEDLDGRKEFSDEAEKIKQQITNPYQQRRALTALRNQSAPVVDFDALFIPDSARTVRLIAPAIAAEDVITSGCDQRELEVVRKTTRNEKNLRPVQLLGTNLWNNADLVDERIGAAKYVQCSIFADSFFAQSQRRATRKFVEDYDAAYHRAPGFLEAHAYDGAAILRKVVEERRPQSRDEMRNALAGMGRAFDGATGDTVFGRDREVQKPLFWLWINRGTIQEFDPEGPPPVPPAPDARTGSR
ncbi:MAG TPA: ABC transporter substrate-binding protein [Myxococcales bacterium]|nr:ABC transporter substrate-binding protein [Myxococcales bacterium]